MSAQAGAKGMFEEDGKMEVDEEVDSKKKLDQRKKVVQQQVRDIEKFTDVPQDTQDVLKEKWQQALQDIEQRRNDFCRELNEYQKRGHRSCRAYQAKRSSARRMWANGLETVSGSGISSKNRMQRWKTMDRQSRKIHG